MLKMVSGYQRNVSAHPGETGIQIPTEGIRILKYASGYA